MGHWGKAQVPNLGQTLLYAANAARDGLYALGKAFDQLSGADSTLVERGSFTDLDDAENWLRAVCEAANRAERRRGKREAA